MFNSQTSQTDEQLFVLLRHSSSIGSHSMMSGVQAELWRRNVGQDKYLEWYKLQKEKEKSSGIISM